MRSETKLVIAMFICMAMLIAIQASASDNAQRVSIHSFDDSNDERMGYAIYKENVNDKYIYTIKFDDDGTTQDYASTEVVLEGDGN